LRLLEGNYILRVPRETGKMPGILTFDSGEVFVTSFEVKGGKKL